MKKLLLTLAAGMLMLALPVIASAAVLNSNTFDEYSGYTASVTVNGFKCYSTNAGATAGFKQFSWTEKANKAITGPKNTWSQMDAVNGGGTVDVWLNARTAMHFIITNAIAPANGKVIHANAIYFIVHTTGDMTLGSNGNQNIPDGFGLTGAEDYIEGGCTITAYNNPTAHNMVMSIAAPTAVSDFTQTYTSVSGTPYYWNQTGFNANWVAATVGYPRMTIPAVRISPINLTPSGSGYSGPWWNLNSGGFE